MIPEHSVTPRAVNVHISDSIQDLRQPKAARLGKWPRSRLTHRRIGELSAEEGLELDRLGL